MASQNICANAQHQEVHIQVEDEGSRDLDFDVMDMISKAEKIADTKLEMAQSRRYYQDSSLSGSHNRFAST